MADALKRYRVAKDKYNAAVTELRLLGRTVENVQLGLQRDWVTLLGAAPAGLAKKNGTLDSLRWEPLRPFDAQAWPSADRLAEMLAAAAESWAELSAAYQAIDREDRKVLDDPLTVHEAATRYGSR